MMPEDTIRALVSFVVKPDKVEPFKALMEALRVPTRAEPGCKGYELLQSVENPALFVCVEEWTNEDAIEAHRTSPHVAAVAPALRDMLAKPLAVDRYKAVWPAELAAAPGMEKRDTRSSADLS